MLYVDSLEGQIGHITLLLDVENIPKYEYQDEESGGGKGMSISLNTVGRVLRLIQRSHDTQTRLDRLREAYDTLRHDYLDLKARMDYHE